MNLDDALKTIYPSRTRFQLEHFVLGQHAQPEQQYLQLLREIRSSKQVIAQHELEIRKGELEIQQLESSESEIDHIEAQIKRLSVDNLQHSVAMSKAELKTLLDLFDRYEHYTPEQIEASHGDYYRDRLLRTAHLQAMTQQVSWAQIEAIWQAGLLPELLAANPQQEIANLAPPELPGGFHD